MIKKLAILFATLTMVLCCTTTAFAEGTGTTTGSITIENAEAGKKYVAYKIFDAAGTSDNMNYAYTIDKNSEWYTIVESYKNDTETNHGLTLEQKEGTETYLVTFNDNFKPADFAKYLKDHMVLKTPTKEITASTGNNKITELPLGYYFVTSEVGTLCNLTTTNKDVTIYDKNVGPKIEKTQKDDNSQVITGDVQLGQTINYEITGKVPSTTGYETYTYKITDTMSEGLTFNKDVKVSIDGTDVTTDATIKYTPEAETAKTGFELTIPVKNYQEKIGTTISVKYTATVNKNAVAAVSKNTAKLEYSNNPGTNETGTTTPVEKKVYTAKIVVDKVEKGTETKLANAEFVLYKKDTATNAVTYYKLTEATTTEPAKVTWVDAFADATVLKTDTNGATEFIGLPNDTYYLKETKAPDGYNVLIADIEITIAGNENDTTTLTHTQKVENNKGTLLPETGGIGTIGLTALAVAVVACALFLPKKKNRA